eukprot:CAMPEP_0202378358 /NCGR_PEP_ID=MMETSP1127-20130417/17680_1 /ASSEMBLY_ACC=CAM_ASM_000462 /TAXON_ID=3047 /ORGANISM="Dunaliella tertiolecta, Strain CCMP1320" /LENGTH=812 /DNA_ID=CAMNT_0048976633 /DNA_START=173 /DNA_END=2611 /DNA_ORIENTATION=-
MDLAESTPLTRSQSALGEEEKGGGEGRGSSQVLKDASLALANETSAPVPPTTQQQEQQEQQQQEQQEQQLPSDPLNTQRASSQASSENTAKSDLTGLALEEADDGALPLAPLDSDAFRWLGVRHRTRSLCRVFGLPDPKEELFSEFHGALRKRVLLQGRVYVFANYVCFTSNPFFGYIKKTVIPFRKVKAIRKKTHCRVPNSIEIETLSGKKEFFTNLLNRQDAFSIIFRCWSRIKPLESQAQLQQQQHHRVQGSSSSADLGSNASKTLRPIAPKSHSYGLDLNMLDKEAAPYASNGRVAFQEQQRSAAAAGADSYANSLGRKNISSQSLSGWSNSSTQPDQATLASEAEGSVEDEDEDDGGNAVFDLVELKPPPPKAPDARVVLSTVIPGTPASLYHVLLANKSHFMEDFLESQGNRRINLTPWKRHHQLAHVRDLSFVAPIRGAFGNWGVSHTQCFQSHRFCRHEGDHLVFESSQTMTDIPYGDCFTVDIRWDITPTTIEAEGDEQETPGLNIGIVMKVPFQRSCLFKKVIESGTQKQVLQTYTAMVDALKPALLEALQPSDLPLQQELEPARGARSSMGCIGAPPFHRSSHSVLSGQGTTAAKEEPSHITVSDGKTQVAVPTTSSLISPAVLDFLNAEASVKAQHVGTLSSSLVRSIARGVRSLALTLNDFLLGLVGCSMNPQLLWLTLLVCMTFVCQLFFFLASWRHGAVGTGGGSVAHGGPPFSTQAPPPPPPSAASPSSASTSTFGAGSSAGGLPRMPQQFWVQRLELLQLEMAMLERRMQLVEGEIAYVGAQQQHDSQSAERVEF